MSEQSATVQRYDVVLLVEQTLSRQDAAQVRALHEELDDEPGEEVHYHVLLPVQDAASRVEGAMGTLAAGEVLAPPGLLLPDEDVQALQRDLLERAEQAVTLTVARLREAGADATGEVVSIDPIEALAAKVQEVDGREAIILTRPHVVAEFFHLDWTSRARRKIGVPVLHLLEHESIDEQSSGHGEGVTGL